MANRRRFFRAAGYLFTYGGAERAGEGTLEMFREDTASGERYFLTKCACGVERAEAYAKAMALVGWLSSLDVPRRREVKAQAVLEQIALLNDRLGRMQKPRNPEMAAGVSQLLEGRITAAA